MFWPFHRRARRPSPRPRPYVRPTLEILEGRNLPSVSVIPFTDPGPLLGLSRVDYIESPAALAIVDAALEGTAREG